MDNQSLQPRSVMSAFSKGKEKKSSMSIALSSILVVLAGIAVGWIMAGNKLSGGKSGDSASGKVGVVNSSDEAGVVDESVFKNSEAPIGILQEGGINGEGTYHLERPGGISQTVYLTSTVIDLKTFVGKKVQVWGETLSGQKAGWLMDVGKIKVVK